MRRFFFGFTSSFLISAGLFSYANAEASVDTAELQWVICNQTPAQIMSLLGARNVSQEEANLYYVETPDEAFYANQVIIRLRERSSKVTTAVKKRYRDIASIPFMNLSGFNVYCEQDTYSGMSSFGCTVKDKSSSLTQLSALEVSYLNAVGAPTNELSRARLWGPLSEMENSFTVNGQEFGIDLVYLAKAGSSLKLSTRVPLNKVASLYPVWTASLAKAQIQFCPDQQEKTKGLLDFLIGQGITAR